jgi:hypothetical protein
VLAEQAMEIVQKYHRSIEEVAELLKRGTLGTADIDNVLRKQALLSKLRLLKAGNPHHDEKGRFSSGDSGGSGGEEKHTKHSHRLLEVFFDKSREASLGDSLKTYAKDNGLRLVAELAGAEAFSSGAKYLVKKGLIHVLARTAIVSGGVVGAVVGGAVELALEPSIQEAAGNLVSYVQKKTGWSSDNAKGASVAMSQNLLTMSKAAKPDHVRTALKVFISALKKVKGVKKMVRYTEARPYLDEDQDDYGGRGRTGASDGYMRADIEDTFDPAAVTMPALDGNTARLPVVSPCIASGTLDQHG